MEKTICNFQLGKPGLSENFFLTLKNAFKTHRNLKICVLKSAGHEKEKVKKYSEEILNHLGKNYTAKIIGFTINIKKWRKEQRK